MVRSWDQCVDLGHGRGRAAPDTAAAIFRIDAELGRPADINEAWRSPEQANANRARWLAYERYLNGGPYAPKAPYALGAEDSVHCDGEAVDSDDWYDPAAAAVWRRNGFRQTARYPGTARDEPWHGEHRPEWDENYGRGVAAGGNATQIPKEWDEMVSKDELTDVVRNVVEGEKSLLFSMNGKLDDWAPSIALIGGVNQKVAWVLASMERDGLLEAEQTRALAALFAAMPAGGGPGAPVDLSPVLAAIGDLDVALAATPAAVRAELASKLGAA